MVHQQLGHTVDARRCMNEASRPIGGPATEERAIPWPDRLEYQILRLEAEAVISYDPIFPADPFAQNRRAAAGARPDVLRGGTTGAIRGERSPDPLDEEAVAPRRF
jgi:hypothetical protein